MAYADDLLKLAQQIASLPAEQSPQPALRRAVSTAYYALFHLLIAEAVANCNAPEFRAALARLFDHGRMKGACAEKVSKLDEFFKKQPPDGTERTVKLHLYNVAQTFSEAQNNRNEADYNLRKEWQPGQVSLLIDGVSGAFESWRIVRDEPEARGFLISMLPGKERRQPDKPRKGRRPTFDDDTPS